MNYSSTNKVESNTNNSSNISIGIKLMHQDSLEEYGENGKDDVVQIKLRTKNSKTPFIKVIGDAQLIVDGIEVSSEEFYKKSPYPIKSAVGTTNSNGKRDIKVSTKKKK